MDNAESKFAKERAARWCKPDGSPVSCTEKIKVMEENFAEITELLQDAIDDAVLMGCSEKTFKQVYQEFLDNLHSSYPEQKHTQEKKE